MKLNQKYEAVIGLEVHAQLNTRSKLFSSDPNLFGAPPNENISVVSLGHPGSLPRLNKTVVEHAIKIGLALGARIEKEILFARKNYFYADLPKGYQISQHENPVCSGGSICIQTRNGEKKVHLTRIHIEEDAGKSIHDLDPAYSLVDLNRAGVPLLEIVSEPELSSPEEAAAYLSEIRKLVRFLDICDGNMEEGSLRCDANVSIKLKTDPNLGTRREIKNLNSINNVRKAIEYEISRQEDILESGEKVIQQTVSYDDQKNITFPLRSKEEADDYRYFPEPDLNPFRIPESWFEEIRANLPPLPGEIYSKFTKEYKLAPEDAGFLTEGPDIAGYYEQMIVEGTDTRSAANWLKGPVQTWINENRSEIISFPLPARTLCRIIKLVSDGLISYTVAQQKIYPQMLRDPQQDPLKIVKEQNLEAETGEGEILKQIKLALDKYPDKIKEYQNGKKGLVGLFMGEVMKISGGKADPAIASKLLIQELNKR